MFSIILIVSAGLLMEIFFPSGIRVLSTKDAATVPSAWAVNGVFSFVATALSLLIPLNHGIQKTLLFGIVCFCYGFSAICILFNQSLNEPTEAGVGS